MIPETWSDWLTIHLEAVVIWSQDQANSPFVMITLVLLMFHSKNTTSMVLYPPRSASRQMIPDDRAAGRAQWWCGPFHVGMQNESEQQLMIEAYSYFWSSSRLLIVDQDWFPFQISTVDTAIILLTNPD